MTSTTPETSTAIGTVPPCAVREQQGNALLLDVRTPAEFEEVHIEGAVLHPLNGLNPADVKKLAEGKGACVVICRSGGRARQAAEKLAAHGLPNLQIMNGGMQSWESEGLPVTRGRATISLQRQVFITAGTMIFIGSVLGYFANPAWIALPAFVGVGLVFAGVTNTCGLAMVLSRMPWNNRAPSSSPPSKPSCCSM
jgi:rhodanese-related sulfurtransferase